VARHERPHARAVPCRAEDKRHLFAKAAAPLALSALFFAAPFFAASASARA
jgi:hypothetical protein